MSTSTKISCTVYKRTARQKVILVFFLQDSLKTEFLNENLNHRRTQTFFQNQGIFFPKSGHFSLIFKKGEGETSPLANCVPGTHLGNFGDAVITK